ncbi:LOW QUALITY PROTEIN: maestro heat-like repeat-containing protein family member 1, partial [Mantella aurantiaca]
FAPDHRDELVEKLQNLRPGLINPDANTLYHTCANIAMVIGKRLPPDQLTSLLFITFESLSDPDPNCSRAAAVIINSLLKERGSLLLAKVPEIIKRVWDQLEESSEDHVKKAAIQAVYILSTQHVGAVISDLLSKPLPYDSGICTLWRSLSGDPALTSQVLDLLLDKLVCDVPYRENKISLLSSSSNRVATRVPLAATCALREVMSQPDSASAVQELHPQLFVSLLLRVSCMVGVQPPRNLGATREKRSPGSTAPPTTLEPCSSAIEALRFMLTQGGNDAVTRSVEEDGGWEDMKREETHHVGVSSLSRAMVRHAAPRLPVIIKNLQSAGDGCMVGWFWLVVRLVVRLVGWLYGEWGVLGVGRAMVRHAAPRLPVIIKNLQSALSNVYDCQRITATAFLAQVSTRSSSPCDLSVYFFLESLMDNMSSRLKDNVLTVRMLAVRGLGNMATGYQKVRKNGIPLLTSLINAMDDRDDTQQLVTQEAMTSLCRLLPLIHITELHPLLIHTTIRIRPFFDHERAELRSASILLFGTLGQVVVSGGEDVFFQQILSGSVTLLLHLQDPQQEVVKACKSALQMCGPNLNNRNLCDMFTAHLHGDRGLHYGEFINNVSKHMVLGFPDFLSHLIQTNITHFKSNWAEIRAAAPMFIGFLVLHMPRDQRKSVDLDHLVTSLVVLLKDPASCVRIKASETMGRLVKFA